MDPNAALAQAREAARFIEQHADADYQGDVSVTAGIAEAGRRLSEAFGALDGWLVTGGFPPAAWYFAPEGDNHHNAAMCPYCSPRS